MSLIDRSQYFLRPARASNGNSRYADEATVGVDRDHIDPAQLSSLGYVVLPSGAVEPYADMYRSAVLLQPPGRAVSREYCVFAASTGFLSSVSDEVKFWWTRNDPDTGITRFGWDGLAQKWLPLKGATPRDLGPVVPEELYKLNPPPTRFSVGDVLPLPSTPDGYSILRVGVYSDSDSDPLDVLVVTDTEAEGGVWDPAWDSHDAVVGVEGGGLFLNPSFSVLQAGRTIWYNPETFVPESNGDMGPVAGLPRTGKIGFPSLSPVPGFGERPFLRIGNRTYLTPNSVPNDASLRDPSSVPSGEFDWSRSTGKIVLSAVDISKCTPGSSTSNFPPDAADYNILFLGAKLYFDGVAMCTRPVPVRTPSVVYDQAGQPLDPSLGGVTVGEASGDLYVQRSVCMPPPGESGVSWVPDGSGDRPDTSILPQTRPNGSGLVRKILAETGDTFFFAFSNDSNYAFENVEVVEYDDDLPSLSIGVPKVDVAVSRMEPLDPSTGLPSSPVPNASRIKLRSRPVRQSALYFRQCMAVPSYFAESAEVYSRFPEPYVLEGTEQLRYALDGVTYTWNAPGAGSFSAASIASSFPPGHAGSERGRVFLRSSSPSSGSVEVGWNSPEQDDLSGHAVLGFLPGWRVDLGDPLDRFRWLPDTGVSLGVFRSPVNLDRSEPGIPDIRSMSEFDNKILTESISQVPFVIVNQPPLEDIPGYGVGSHFKVQIGLLNVLLRNYQTSRGVGVKYEWDNNRFSWLEEGETGATRVNFPSSVLQLENTSVLPETLSSEAMLDGSYGLFLKGASSPGYSSLELGEDFLMPGDGQPGQALRIMVEGGRKFKGGKGSFVSGGSEFSDPNVVQSAFLSSAQSGYILHISGGDSEGVYTVTGVRSVVGQTILDVSPDFPHSDSSARWDLYEAKTRDNLDGTLLADVQQIVRNHLPYEPFVIRLLSSVGVVGGSLVSDPADAMRSGRIVKVRIGMEHGSPESQISYLNRGVTLGLVRSIGLRVDPSDIHVSTSTPGSVHFQLRIGSTPYVPTVDGSGLVDVDITTGSVSIDASIVSAQVGSDVFYDQTFLDPSDLAQGECELDPNDGSINLSSVDVASNPGVQAYFVEQMVTENNLDVTTSPLNGSVLFNKPLRAGQVVEVEYFRADTNGDVLLDPNGDPVQVVEFLPLIVQLEEATRLDDRTFSYNPTGRTLSSEVENFVWVGVELQNFAGSQTTTSSEGRITLVSPAPSSSKVQINYGVLEAFGGEQAYTVSSPPVYRKPFWLEAGQDTFVLSSDRTGDFPLGHLMLVGPSPFYITSVSFDAVSDSTEISVFPVPLVEVGSRAVGIDESLSVSNLPVSVGRGGAVGFMPLLDTSANPMLPSDKGQLQVSFYGDVRRYARPGHILEIDGYPYLVVSSSISVDGRVTSVDIATPVYKDHDNSQPVRISTRQVYQSNPVEFSGILPFVPTEEYELFLLGRRDGSGNEIPGSALVEGVHYSSDPNTGSVTFKSPNQLPLKPWEYLHFRYTGSLEVSPGVVDGAVLYPTYKSKYLFVTQPSRSNRVLGQVLRAKYTFRDPDSFYFSIKTLEDYLPEVGRASGSMGASPVGSGPPIPFSGQSDIGSQGVLGTRGELHDYKDQDRAARAYVSIFNGVVLAFEQVLEAMDGRIIGDRDGKFRFFIGRGSRYPRPGWEDQITGELVVRLIWREVVDEWSPEGFGGWYNTSDPVFDPTTAEEKDGNPTSTPYRPGDTDGETPNPDTLRYFSGLQRNRVKNDMDDRLLVGFGRSRGFAALFPSIDVPGNFRYMWEPHRYSRLFPESTQHFNRLLPGLGYRPGSNVGFYSSGRKVTVPGPFPGEETEQTVKTRGSSIGAVANPVLGNISNVVEVTAVDRLPRARVWAFYPNGSAELDSALGTSTVGIATIVATPLPLGEFPIDPDTGFPDVSEMVTTSNPNGSVLSLESGDVELSTPAFEVGQRVNYGKPDGVTYTLTDSSGNGIFVASVQVGCVVTLGDVNGSGISGSGVLYNGSEPLQNVTRQDDGYGDTLFCGSAVDLSVLGPVTELPTTKEEVRAVVNSLPDYRIQFDLKVGKRTGEFIDASLPVVEDSFPLPIQTWLGQKPPNPLSCIEGLVEFVNTDQEPAKLPCLLGQDKDDTGDNQIPYIKGTDTELSVLGRVASDFRTLFADTTAVPPHLWLAVFPDEIIGTDGQILVSGYDIGAGRDPSTLYTNIDLTPVATAGVYTPNSGVGDARPFDLLLLEVGQPSPIPPGITGILSIGDVQSDRVEVPRFVTPVQAGGLVKHTIENAAVAVNRGGSEGVIVTQTNPSPGVYVTTFDFSSVGFQLDDGSGTGVGGYNQFFGVGSTGNAIIVRIFDTATGVAIESVVVSDQTPSPGVWGTVSAPGGAVLLSTPSATGGVIVLTTDAPVSSVANTGLLYDCSISVDAYTTFYTSSLTGLTVGSANGTTTASVGGDRLTFSERLDLSKASERGTTTALGSVDVSTTLYVWEVEIGGAQGCTVNGPSSVNSGVGFSFLERLNGLVPYVGTFSPASGPGAGDESGSLKVMSWEANGNSPLDVSDLSGIKFGAVASSDADDNSIILSGTGTNLDRVSLGALVRGRTWLQDVSVSTGGIQNVESGDVLVVEGSSTPGMGAVKTGTYIVRHTVEDNSSASDGTLIRNVSGIVAAAGNPEVMDLTFPKILSSSQASLSLTTDVLASATSSPTGHAWESSGRLYLILREDYAEYNPGTSTWTVFRDSVYSAAYGSVTLDPTTGEATFSSLSGFQDAYGGILATNVFFSAAVRNVKVSGMVYTPFRRLHPDLPENNCVGYNLSNLGFSCVGGVQEVHLGSSRAGGGDVGYDTTSGSLLRNTGLSLLPGPSRVRVNVPVGEDSTGFYQDRDTVVYPPDSLPILGGAPVGVATHMSLEYILSSDWDDQHFNTSGGNSIVEEDGVTPLVPALGCLLPGDIISIGDSLSGGNSRFRALAGVFLEPSSPIPTSDLGQLLPKVVSNSYNIGSVNRVGMRNYDDFNLVPAGSEGLRFSVRRIRRFHEQSSRISAGLEPLKYAYQTRRGEFGSYDPSSREFVAVKGGLYEDATNLGDFDNRSVNINSGDILRVIDPASGEVTDASEIQRVVNSVTLKLRRPGLTNPIPAGARFEVYLEQAIVPHEQSNEQLLNLITDRVVYERRVDYPSGDTDGGFVGVSNELKDTQVTSWAAEGVEEGDYVLVDPAGVLYLPNEFGVRPLGDQSVSERGSYIPGLPSDLDDNRGFYRVEGVTGDTLEVNGSSRFSDGSKFGDAGAEYVVLPTVNDGAEGQQDLRVTEAAVAGSFVARGSNNSVEPFGYRIIRINPVFSKDTVELVLFMRERMLSWIEALNTVYRQGGDYYTFQKDDHILSIGSNTDPTSGSGVIHNVAAIILRGLVDVQPFANNSQCLSVLDRRFWVLDSRLDSLPVGGPDFYTQFATDGEGQRPVLPDLIEEVLNLDDRIRDQRYSWISFRSNRTNGSAQRVVRAENNLSSRIRKQREEMSRAKSLKES